MNYEVLAAIAAGLIGAILPAGREIIQVLIKQGYWAGFFRENPSGQRIAGAFGVGYTKGSADLFKELSSASEKMDSIVRQVQEYTKGREQAVSKLESELGLLSQQEEELKQRIEGLRNVPLPAAEYFAQLVRKGERRSAFRDYILFLLGVIVTAGVGVLLRKLGWA